MPERLVIVAANSTESGSVESRLIRDGGDGIVESTVARLALAFRTDVLKLGRHPALRADCWRAVPDDMANTLPHVPLVGDHPGEVWEGLFRQGFVAGYKSVCIIASDMPHLPVAFVQEAFGRLAFGADVVLGPAEDGGCYLVALREPMPALFTQIPSGSGAALEHMRRAAEDAGRDVRLLPTGYRVNTLKDVARLFRDLRRGIAYAPATEAIAENLPIVGV